MVIILGIFLISDGAFWTMESSVVCEIDVVKPLENRGKQKKKPAAVE